MDSHRLVLHEHPFASYCQKALIALYELDLPFDTRLIVDEASRRELAALWPLEKMPVLRDETAALVLPESTTIIEYLDSLSPDGPRLVPPTRQLRCRPGCGIASTTVRHEPRCRRSSATGCVPTAGRDP